MHNQCMNKNRLVLQVITFLIAIVTTLISLVLIDSHFDEKKANPTKKIDFPINSDSINEGLEKEPEGVGIVEAEKPDTELKVNNNLAGEED